MLSADLKKELVDFATWLVQRGHDLLPTKGEWEVIRWRPPSGDGPYIGYTNKHRREITKFNDRGAENLYLEFHMERAERPSNVYLITKGTANGTSPE